MQLKLNYIKYIFSNHLFKKSSDVASPVLPKAKECPTLIAAAYVGLGASSHQKRRVYIPLILWEFLWDFIQLKIHYSKEYTVQGNGYFSSRSVQGCIRADSANRNFNIIFLHGVQYPCEFYGVHYWVKLSCNCNRVIYC